MQPFLLAFVDSRAFELLSMAFLLPFVLAGVVVVWLLVMLTRSGLRDSRRLRSPTVAATGWQHLGVAARLVPAALIGLVALLVGLGEVLDASQEGQAGTAYQQALHRKEVRQQAKVAGRYILADSRPPEPNPAWYTGTNGWALADTAQLAADRASHGRLPRVELWLRPDGTFTYYSTIAGDKAGTQAIGNWQLHGNNWEDPGTMAGLKKMSRYYVTFEFLLPLVGEPGPLRGIMDDEEDATRISMSGSYYLQGHHLSFDLKQAPLPLASLAPQVPQTLPAFSPF